MNKISKKFYIAGFLAIYIVSFCGEVACVTYELALINEKSMVNVSLLMVAFLAGGILFTPFSIILLGKIALLKILQLIFFCSGLVVMATSASMNPYVAFVASLLLGLLSSCFWSALALIISTIFEQDRFDQVNKLTHSIRNIGYIAGPSLAGCINGYVNIKLALFMIGCCFWMGIPCSYILLPMYEGKIQTDVTKSQKSFLSTVWLYGHILFRLPNMKKTLLPLIVTICFASTSNIAFLHLMVNVLHYSKATYGLMASLTSIGLVGGPFFFSSLFSKRGESFGVCMAALLMGLCIAATSFFESLVGLSLISLMLGIANGLQNTLMWTFLMKTMAKDQKSKIIPVYILILQVAVLIGFSISSIVSVTETKLFLLMSGLTSFLFGGFGAALNYKDHQTIIMED